MMTKRDFYATLANAQGLVSLDRYEPTQMCLKTGRVYLRCEAGFNKNAKHVYAPRRVDLAMPYKHKLATVLAKYHKWLLEWKEQNSDAPAGRRSRR